MKKVNEEKFLAAYKKAVEEKEFAVANKESVLEAEKAKVEEILGDKFSDTVKELCLKEALAEKEKEFDFEALDAKIAAFEEYLDEIEEVVEEPAVEESVLPDGNVEAEAVEAEPAVEEVAEEVAEAPVVEEVQEVKLDEFGHKILD